MRVYFRVIGKQAQIVVYPTDADTDSYVLCMGDKRSAFEASAVVSAMQTALNSQMEHLRRSAYQHGWKDAKAKRRKKEDFFSSMRVSPSGNCGY